MAIVRLFSWVLFRVHLLSLGFAINVSTLYVFCFNKHAIKPFKPIAKLELTNGFAFLDGCQIHDIIFNIFTDEVRIFVVTLRRVTPKKFPDVIMVFHK